METIQMIKLNFPSTDVLESWQLDILTKRGLKFDINLIKLGVSNVIESWTYLDLEQSFNLFKTPNGQWAVTLSEQVLNDLFDECLNFKFN